MLKVVIAERVLVSTAILERELFGRLSIVLLKFGGSFWASFDLLIIRHYIFIARKVIRGKGHEVLQYFILFHPNILFVFFESFINQLCMAMTLVLFDVEDFINLQQLNKRDGHGKTHLTFIFGLY